MAKININIKTQNSDFIKEFLELEEHPEKNTEKDIIEGISITYRGSKELVEPVPELEDWPGCGDEIECIDIDLSVNIEDSKLIEELTEWLYNKLENQEPIPFLNINENDTAIMEREIRRNLKKHF